jgi:HK97 family phage prohead protease
MSDFIHRLVPLEASIKPGDGRTVEAYAAVFESEAEIRDHQGHYREVIDPAAFSRVINRAKPQGGRDYWLTKVFYNHGMTLHGTPSEEGSVPVGRTEHIEADSKGLLTVTRYLDDPFSQKILGAIREGAITAQSFTGQIVRSSPTLTGRRQHMRTRDGELPLVRRLELGLTEYGPTPVPAYANAEVVGVRSLYQLPAAPDDDELVEDSETEDAASDEALVAADSPARRSERQDQFQRRLEVALRARGIKP